MKLTSKNVLFYRPKNNIRYFFQKFFHYTKNIKGHGVHSPFVYKLINEVIEEKYDYYAYREIQICISELKQSNLLVNLPLLNSDTNKNISCPIFQFINTCDIKTSHAKLLFRLCNRFNPKSILQIGTATGISSLYLSWYSKEVQLIALDEQNIFLKDKIFDFLKRNHKKTPKLISNSLEKSSESLTNAFSKIDFLYIQQVVDKKSLLPFFNKIATKLHEDSIVVIEGIHSYPEISDFWTDMKMQQSTTITIDLYSMGILFFKKKLYKKDYSLFF